VVVTHHLPHPGSIHPRFADDALTPAFCSDLSELVESSGAVLWVHGHTHESCDYVAGGTRVVCNPKGYGPIRQGGRYENMNFDPGLAIEI
jgi:Icc-related predicted phosphoesterase